MTDFAVLNKINRRLHQLQRDGVEFIAGTIAPADSDHETNDIESVAKAIEYYQNKNPDIVLTIQPKWMGSRAQMYLYRDDINKSFMTTRNGLVYRDWETIKTGAETESVWSGIELLKKQTSSEEAKIRLTNIS